jgi:S-adenosylmethionine-dependent carboxyl methyltransferase
MLNVDEPVLCQSGEDSIDVRLPHGVMEGNGAYNKHAKNQAAAAALATPLLEKAVGKMRLDPEDQPIVIADYGPSQGKNSLGPMRIAIENLRRRLGPSRPIVVFHIDQPSNDFNSLFEALNSDPGRYVLDEPNIFPCAIGRSFYEQVLPAGSVHLGWSSYAAQWLRSIPSAIPDHFWSARSTGAARAAFEHQAAEDWKAFLSLRASEMRPGARLVIVLPALAEDGSSGFAAFMDDANAVLQEMVDEGAITAQEWARMVLRSHLRRKSELLAPFAKEGQFQKLIVEDCEVSTVPDPVWAKYQQDGDKEALARDKALFFRSTFMPSLASSLTRVRAGDAEALRVFADRLQDGLTQRLARHPAPTDSLVETIALARCD